MPGRELPRAGHPGGAVYDCPWAPARDARVKLVHDEAESVALFSGRRLGRLGMGDFLTQRVLGLQHGVGGRHQPRQPATTVATISVSTGARDRYALIPIVSAPLYPPETARVTISVCAAICLGVLWPKTSSPSTLIEAKFAALTP
jgi:hypothetical protein